MIRETVNYVYMRGQFMALGFGVLFYGLSPYVYAIFTDDSAIIAMAVSYIRTMVFAFPFITVGVVSGRIFQGLGEGIPSLLLTAMRVVLVSGALAFLFVRVLSMGLESVWWALALGAAITSTISFVWLRWQIGRLESCA